MRPSIDKTHMETAKLWATRSTCSRAQVGAVIALDGRGVGTGYNGAPAGLAHCNHELPFVPVADSARVVYNPVSPLGPFPGPLGKPRDNACRIAIHAETNAIAYAARHGVAVLGGTLYVTLSPCYSCAQLIISAGLVRVVYDRAYRDPEGVRLLDRAGVTVEKWIE